MCGIAGIMTADGRPPDGAALDRLSEALLHRGPDGRGRRVAGDTGLVQTRLAIIDLETGDQPIFGPDGDAGPALIANAEIYNYIELRDAMPDVGFRTRSDCEPPLYLYLRHGPGFAGHLRGMYAIAVHDPAKGRLMLARDPFGIKPLYYTETERGFAFASELQALVAAGLAGAGLRAQAVDELLHLQFTTGAETMLEGIHRVLPGETLIVESGRIADSWRIPALPLEAPQGTGEADAVRDLDTVLEDSVRLHQRSDVPYGMFLSGGIDSSALLAMMGRLNERPVQAFTAGFSGTDVADERAAAAAVAAATGAEHHRVEVSEEDFWDLLPEIAAAIDDPAADYAVLPTFKLAREAKRVGLKVVLCGEGGDELFAGYGRYRRARRPAFLGGRRTWHAGGLDGLGLLRAETPDWRSGIAAAEAALPAGLTRLQEVQAIDCADWLPHDLLTKLDRCLMANGVEGRVPFVDLQVAAFAFRLPDRLKVRRTLGKWLLRKWLDAAVPEARAFARKRGFTVPVGEWISHRGADVAALVARQPGVEEACEPDAVEALFRSLASGRGRKKGSQAAWTLLYYALWHRRHVLGLPPEGGVFETLSAKS